MLGILSEENVKVHFQDNLLDTKYEWLWILDPLDGQRFYSRDRRLCNASGKF